MSTLYIVATPIGNLQDLSPRALSTLESVELILCEDTRVTKKLLEHFGIYHKKLLSYWSGNQKIRINEIIEWLASRRDAALVSDAGTPGISDPGGLLIEAVVEKLGDRVKIAPIPGPVALAAVLSISGFPADKFIFLGFPPSKNKRRKYFDEITKSQYTAVFYESKHRIMKSLEDLKKALERKKALARPLMVARELTKQFETIYRGQVEEILNQLKQQELKGEFVVVVRKP